VQRQPDRDPLVEGLRVDQRPVGRDVGQSFLSGLGGRVAVAASALIGRPVP
jgi:hypothetical protein